MIDDQGWGTLGEGRRAYQRRHIVTGTIACVVSSSFTLRVAGRIRVVRNGRHVEGGLRSVVCCGSWVSGVLWKLSLWCVVEEERKGTKDSKWRAI